MYIYIYIYRAKDYTRKLDELFEVRGKILHTHLKHIGFLWIYYVLGCGIRDPQFEVLRIDILRTDRPCFPGAAATY